MSGESKIAVSCLHKIDGDGKMKAFADVEFEGLIVKGFRVVQGKKGLFVGLPQQLGKDGQWYNVLQTKTKELQNEISEIVLKAYSDS